MRYLTACLAIALFLSCATTASAAPGDDGYIEGYAAALLERELGRVPASLRVRNGVVTLQYSDLADADRARVIPQLERIRGVVRVEVVEAGAQPTPPPVIVTREPPKVFAEYQAGLLPGSVLFKPLIADPRWPRFGASWQHYIGDKHFSDLAAVSFGESFAFYRDRIGSVWWDIRVYAFPNGGIWYDFGFVIGAAIFFGAAGRERFLPTFTDARFQLRFVRAIEHRAPAP